jgi:peptidoglycan/LPS O-acetylase OafA/YrhL
MKSSTGAHYVRLDHIRAIAALMVFVWHFTHAESGYPAPFEGAPAIFPLALFDEGHTGVSLFMVLSGYLFAKLLDGRAVNYAPFFWNRFLRLAPLLFLVCIIQGVQTVRHGDHLLPYLRDLLDGFVFPRWPNGGWSITVEMHFYIALPLLLYLSRRWRGAQLVGVLLAIALRYLIYVVHGQVQDSAYWTIIGRADDFLFGMAAFTFRDFFRNNHIVAACVALTFTGFFWWFDYSGGFYQIGKGSSVWIVLPTIEAASYSTLVAYYDTTYRQSACSSASWALSKIGDYSYSIYLLHVFVVFHLAHFVHERIMNISNFYVAFGWAIACFSFMVPIGFLSYNYFEMPFLQLRKKYILPPNGRVSEGGGQRNVEIDNPIPFSRGQ